ncbi:TIGR03619 family F420-dependent LLM class oxidoreductase [Streptomyces chrestomyceticus]|uniref:TIGR03619 family F420-dependent LLM class oxidoreductase n=1 Tax=Streptomyces chrestomyceticus TaxID=68185 RepID=UPI0033D086D5
MRTATVIFLTDETIRPDRLARALEERGFTGLYLPEHSHIPVDRKASAIMGDPLPREFGRTLDAFVALGQAAVVTERLALGTGITLVAQHDPINLAKQVATLDFLSGGRFTLGVGLGWIEEEAADHGVEWATRRELVRDRLALMRALWAAEPTAYEGAFGSVRASHAHPKPVRGAPRTLLGGVASAKLFSHIAQYADGWLPNDGRDDLTGALPALQQAWQREGREKKPEVVLYGVRPSAEKLAHFRDLGVEEVVLQLPSAGEAEVLRTLDDYAQYL